MTPIQHLAFKKPIRHLMDVDPGDVSRFKDIGQVKRREGANILFVQANGPRLHLEIEGETPRLELGRVLCDIFE